MPSYTVKYWKRISETAREPHSTSIRERKLTMLYRGDEAWCKTCKAVVEYEGRLSSVLGIVEVCPFCGERVNVQT
jgi:Zn finger protein HypA/HybF involved in hydrogenase expression